MDQYGFINKSPKSIGDPLNDINFYTSTQNNMMRTNYQFADRTRMIHTKSHEDHPVYQNKTNYYSTNAHK